MSSFDVFAVEDTTVQVTWRGLRSGERLHVEVTREGSREVVASTAADGVPAGGAVLNGLAPRTAYVARLSGAGDDHEAPFETLGAPKGAPTFKLATINDLHVGNDSFGYLDRMHEGSHYADLHPIRCSRAAIADALEWGAQMLVVKGDLTHKGWPEQWAQVGEMLAGLPVPVAIAPGNHDLGPDRTVEPQAALAALGLHLAHGVEAVDLPGIRLVLADTVIPGSNGGRIAYLQEDVCGVVARAPGPALVAMHHHPQRFSHPTFLPRGIPGPEARAFLAAVAAANPRTLVTTGHTHRHRRHQIAGLTVTEVGSTKDYPGAWAGYAVSEGGIRQVVRRITRPDCIEWTERTRRAALGFWGIWAPGRLADRCFTVDW
jgi:predicted phosphodiesterase